MTTAQVYRRVKPFKGIPTDDNIQLCEENLPSLGNGDVLYEAEYLTVDPYMRIKMGHLSDGSVMVGEQVARVVASNNSRVAVGSHHVVNCGWRNRTVLNPDQSDVRIKTLPPGIKGLPLSLALGTLGMPGATAYMGIVKVLEVQPGKTILVTSASGAVGQVACQLAHIKGCKVIGCAGSKEKCDFLKSVGVDVVFNYKTDNVDRVLAESAPEGLNYYVDNIGGSFTDNIITKHLVKFGRAVIIGTIANYNLDSPPPGIQCWDDIKSKCLRVEGMQVYEFPPEDWQEAFENISRWIKEGKLKYKEHVTEGFENMRKAFYELFTGDNFGKAVVKV